MTDFYAEEWSLGFEKEKEINSICAVFTTDFINSVERQYGKEGLHAWVNMQKFEFKKIKQKLSKWLSQKLTDNGSIVGEQNKKDNSKKVKLNRKYEHF